MATNITTLKNAEKTDNLIPRTEIKAIFDKDGNYCDQDLTASDLNTLKGGAGNNFLRYTDAEAGTPIPTDADKLQGHPASYFATAEALSSLNNKTEDKAFVPLTNGISNNITIGMVNGMVIIACTGSATIGTTYVNIGSVPSGFRKPSQKIISAITLGGTASITGFLNVETDGSVQIYNGSGGTETSAWGQLVY